MYLKKFSEYMITGPTFGEYATPEAQHSASPLVINCHVQGFRQTALRQNDIYIYNSFGVESILEGDSM